MSDMNYIPEALIKQAAHDTYAHNCTKTDGWLKPISIEPLDSSDEVVDYLDNYLDQSLVFVVSEPFGWLVLEVTWKWYVPATDKPIYSVEKDAWYLVEGGEMTKVENPFHYYLED